MIPNSTDLAEKLGVAAVLFPLVLAGLLTGLTYLVQSIAQWSNERNP